MTALLLALLAAVSVPAAHAETVRVGVFVGNNIGMGQDEPLAYAESEARDMARLFQSMGDLDRERTTVLTGGSAATVRDAIYQTEAQVREINAAGDEVLLVFYYSGHASAQGLHLGGQLLPMAALRRWLEKSTAQVRVAFVDACESGTLAQVRGGTPVDAIDIVVDDVLTTAGLAIVTSTGPLSVARESASFGGGVFSRALITGLRGSADSDGNGEITLDEAYRFAFSETVVGTAGRASSVQRPEYRYEISGVGSVVLTRLPSRAAGLLFPEELEGVYTVVSVGSGQVVARLDKKPGQQRRLALPTGRYVVRKVRRQDALLAEVDLVWGGDRWIEDGQMDTVALGDPLARGGWNVRPVQASARGLVSPPLMRDNPSHGGLELSARFRTQTPFGVETFLQQSWGNREVDLGLELAGSTFRAGVGAVAERHLQRVDLALAAGVQAGRHKQFIQAVDFDEGEAQGVLSYDYGAALVGAWGQASLTLPLGPMFGVEVGARGSFDRTVVDDQGTWLLGGQAWGGLTASFGGGQRARAGKRQ